jgi:hypothetical protein
MLILKKAALVLMEITQPKILTALGVQDLGMSTEVNLEALCWRPSINDISC